MKRSSPVGLSLVINTFNEVATLQRCIESVGSLATEVIVMDMHSTDDTQKLARSLGAKVYTFPRVGYVEPARQKAIEKATGDWILVLDADEQISPTLQKKIQQLIQKKDLSIISIPTKNIIFSTWLKGAGYWPNYHIRLFRRGLVKWPSQIHSAPKALSSVYTLPAQERFALLHTVVTNPNAFLAKTDSYTNFEQGFTHFVGAHGFSGRTVLQYCHGAFQRFFFEQQGNADGFAGFTMSKLMEVYAFAEVAKYWLRQGSPVVPGWEEALAELQAEQSFRQSLVYKIWRKYQVFKARFLTR